MASTTGGIRVTYDVDRAAIGQQMIEFGPIGQFIDALEIDQQQSMHILDRRVEVVKINRFVAVIGTHANDITFVPYYIDQFKLLEERREGIETFAHLWSCLDGNT